MIRGSSHIPLRRCLRSACWLIGLSVLVGCAHAASTPGTQSPSAQEASAPAPGMLAMRNVERQGAKLGALEVVDTTRLPPPASGRARRSVASR